jgi:hypothetical protein
VLDDEPLDPLHLLDRDTAVRTAPVAQFAEHNPLGGIPHCLADNLVRGFVRVYLARLWRSRCTGACTGLALPYANHAPYATDECLNGESLFPWVAVVGEAQLTALGRLVSIGTDVSDVISQSSQAALT